MGWPCRWHRQAGALNLSTAAGARVGRDENLALVALGAFVHGRHALDRLVEVDDEPPARWLCEAHRNGGVCRGGGEAVEVDAPPDERLVRCLLLLAKVAQASIQPFWARPTAAAAAPPLVEECVGQQLRAADGTRVRLGAGSNPSLPYHQACPSVSAAPACR